VDVAHQLQQIGILLAEDGFVSVLKEGAVAAMASIVGEGITGEEPPHEGGKGQEPSP